MPDLFAAVLAELAAGRPAVLATMVGRQGSAPRAPGARLLLKADGSLSGTVGGGLLEAQTLELARRLLAEGGARLLHFDLVGPSAEAAGMICGGLVDVWVERLEPTEADLIAFLSRRQDLARAEVPALAALAVAGAEPSGRRYLLTVDQPQAWPADLAEVRERFLAGRAIRTGLKNGYFVEPLAPPPTVYLFGGGHVSLQIAPLASLVEFRLVVVDDRPEFASPERFPWAEEVVCRPFEGVMAELKPGPSAYLVIVTRGHRGDGLVLAQALRTPAAYIGMIGSRRKRDLLYEHLLAQGFSQEDLKRVHCPIGLDIQAETPEEIALAIMAELVQERAKAGQGGARKNWVV